MIERYLRQNAKLIARDARKSAVNREIERRWSYLPNWQISLSQEYRHLLIAHFCLLAGRVYLFVKDETTETPRNWRRIMSERHIHLPWRVGTWKLWTYLLLATYRWLIYCHYHSNNLFSLYANLISENISLYI